MMIDFKNFEDMESKLIKGPNDEFLLSTKDTAYGLGISPSTIRDHKINYADELFEGTHFFVEIFDKNKKGRPLTFWTIKGIIRLSYIIKTERAKQFRIWSEELAAEYDYDFVRMPAIGKKGLTILEAKLDSAKVMMHLGSDPKKILSRLHDCLRIVRNAIEEDKRATFPYMKIKRCTFRETVATRCNKAPVKQLELPDGTVVYRCKKHFNLDLQSVQPEIPKYFQEEETSVTTG